MKISILTCISIVVSAAALEAQVLPAPDTIKPTTTFPTPSPAALDKMAEEAQKSVLDAVDSKGAVQGVPSQPSSAPTGLAPAPIITTRADGGTRTTFSRPVLPQRDDPALWPRDSIHKLAVMEVKVGGNVDSVIMELYPADAPQTVSNFIDRCESKAYDGLAFHRAIENFLVQTGDPLTADEEKREEWGTGGEDSTIPAEIKRKHRMGAVAMARRSDKVNPSRRSNGSQFYIALGNFNILDGQYTVFGQVVDGLDVLQHVSRMPVDSNDCPVARIEVESIRIVDHKGPLLPRSASSGKRSFRKPGTSKGWIDRLLERVW